VRLDRVLAFLDAKGWRLDHQSQFDCCPERRRPRIGSLCAAKGFVATATRGWAKELTPDGIRVNAVSPGVILTPFHDRFSTPEQPAAMQATIPMGRAGLAEECAGAFLYLASEQMSGYVTRQMIEVNGGQYMP
jgi:3-oxoacyl-[acyl-carrier protein] reductase